MSDMADIMAKLFRLDDVPALGMAIAAIAAPGLAIGLIGDLGSGKTTLVRAILHALGHTGEVPSPSYALVQPYAPPATRLPVLHVDLYRLNAAEQVYELGLADALSDHILLIEWPQCLQGLPGHGIGMAHLPLLSLAGDDPDFRSLSINDHPIWNNISWPI
jgi:tRNA threonylcarbamoyladenosine biosynthesis protein TsaE